MLRVLISIAVALFVILVLFVPFEESADHEFYVAYFDYGWRFYEPIFHVYGTFLHSWDLLHLLPIINSVLYAYLIIRRSKDLLLPAFTVLSSAVILESVLFTQYRFGLATLIFALGFTFRSKITQLFVFAFSCFIHIGLVIPMGVGLWCFVCRKLRTSIIFEIGIPSLVLISGIIFSDQLFTLFGKGYYVGTTYTSVKSVQSILFVLLDIPFWIYLFWKCKKAEIERENLILIFILYLICLVYVPVAIIGGRYLKVYLFFQPFLFWHLWQQMMGLRRVWLRYVLLLLFFGKGLLVIV